MSDKIHVMIVEDDDVAAKIYEQFTLKLDQYCVIATASSGQQALQLLEVAKPDLILLDIYLPDISGIELLREVRNRGLGIDVILITAANDAETVSEAIRGGAFSYLIKPISIDRYLAALEQYSRARSELIQGKQMSQNEVDLLFHKAEKDASHQIGNSLKSVLPKGIDKFTLKNVRNKIQSQSGLISTDDLANLIGSSHSTARKYLEYLVSINELDVEIFYGTVGRPERKYRRLK
ncbi:response regulator [Scopulibacillus cellulosilyticus]|uniref:Transcriptional regulatory protein n=1 Tax=Scopulibacillus cellulosilyticus TaxID=2665665 RepID=A0ABW2PZ73_9BACL